MAKTELEFMESVAHVIKRGYERPSATQTLPQLTDWDLEIARNVIARVRQHDRQADSEGQ